MASSSFGRVKAGEVVRLLGGGCATTWLGCRTLPSAVRSAALTLGDHTLTGCRTLPSAASSAAALPAALAEERGPADADAVLGSRILALSVTRSVMLPALPRPKHGGRSQLFLRDLGALRDRPAAGPSMDLEGGIKVGSGALLLCLCGFEDAPSSSVIAGLGCPNDSPKARSGRVGSDDESPLQEGCAIWEVRGREWITVYGLHKLPSSSWWSIFRQQAAAGTPTGTNIHAIQAIDYRSVLWGR